MRVPLPVHSYRSSLPLSAQRLVNMFPERAPPGSLADFALFPSPGLKPFATVGAGPVRGQKVFNEVLHTVSGGELYSVSSSGAGTLLGSIPGEGPVDMDCNFTQLAIVNDPDAYVLQNGALAKITDPDYQGAHSVAMLDQIGVFANREQYFWTEVANFASLDALDFKSAEGHPDKIRALAAEKRDLFILGDDTIEIDVNLGGDPPFSRKAFIQEGCGARGSVATLDNTIFWLDKSFIARRLNGVTPQRVSTHAVERAIQSYTNPSNAIATTYVESGHLVYEVKFDQAVWSYDVNNDRWQERETYRKPRYRGQHAVSAYGKVIVGDEYSGALYEMDDQTHQDPDGPIQRVVTLPPIGNGTTEQVMDKFQVLLETGQGLTTGQGSNPQVMLRWSDDGGRTWSNEHWSTAGKRGNYLEEVTWTDLGCFQSRVMQLVMSDPVRWVLHAADAEIT